MVKLTQSSELTKDITVRDFILTLFREYNRPFGYKAEYWFQALSVAEVRSRLFWSYQRFFTNYASVLEFRDGKGKHLLAKELEELFYSNFTQVDLDAGISSLKHEYFLQSL